MPFSKVEWKARNKEHIRQYNERYARQLKAKICAHYGPDGTACCSWPDCDVDDLDILVIDHIDNSGGNMRRAGESFGNGFYLKLVREGLPEGYQTLCCNHNWKKEILRRKAEGSKWRNYNV